MNNAGRLRLAGKLLNDIAERGSFDDTDDELIRTGKAAALAVDFYHISTTLGDDREHSLAVEIGLTLGGSLDPDEKNTTPYEFQSQFWTGTLLAQSGFKTTYLGGKRKGPRPDFLVESNTFECAVEIKRPQSISSARRALGTAASQLHEFGKPGIIILDHSGSLFTDDLHRIHESLRQEVVGYTRSEKYTRIILLISFARFWSWKPESDFDTDSGIRFIADTFPKACSGLVTPYSERMQHSLERGIEQLTGNKPSTTDGYR